MKRATPITHSHHTLLGIDPGYARIGWAILSYDGRDFAYEKAECIETDKNLEFSARLGKIYAELTDIITEYKPDSVSIESLFFNTNTKTALQVAHARGVIQLASYHQHIPTFEYTPLQVKQAIIGYGRGDKTQVKQMLSYQITLPKIRNIDDIFDAIAVAITHARFAGI